MKIIEILEGDVVQFPGANTQDARSEEQAVDGAWELIEGAWDQLNDVGIPRSDFEELMHGGQALSNKQATEKRFYMWAKTNEDKIRPILVDLQSAFTQFMNSLNDSDRNLVNDNEDIRYGMRPFAYLHSILAK